MPAPGAPVLERADPEGLDTLTVRFDQIVETGSVETESTYLLRRVDDPLTTVAVTEAVRILDGCFVRLALERRLEVDVEYRLEALDILGECGLTADSLSALVMVSGPAGSETPEPGIALSQNYPNPFNPATRLRYELPEAARVAIRVYDILGREVRTLREGDERAGTFFVDWDGRDSEGIAVSSGVYVARLRALGVSGSSAAIDRKMMLVR